MPNSDDQDNGKGINTAMPRSPIIPNQTYSVPQAAAALGVSTISVWRYIYAGRLRRCRLGRRTIITGAQLLDLLAASESGESRQEKTHSG
ncbi:MAG: helix-turn-helix domain-containing protein [Acidobacteria bacterium]|nr:helix-turn-helix domain-containing protein [Acidobacteriota bacterium]